jgi:hypothetical protein
VLLLAAPDFLGYNLMRGLEQRWAAAAEHEADRRACDRGGEQDTRYALASAIVKVARMMPPAPMLADAMCTLVDGTDIESRVRSLLDAGAIVQPPARRSRILATLAAAAAAAAAGLAYAPLLWTMHEATEFLVYLLP